MPVWIMDTDDTDMSNARRIDFRGPTMVNFDPVTGEPDVHYYEDSSSSSDNSQQIEDDALNQEILLHLMHAEGMQMLKRQKVRWEFDECKEANNELLVPQSVSLLDCEGDATSDSVEFYSRRPVLLRHFEELSAGQSFELASVGLCHAHVHWFCALRVRCVQPGEYAATFVHLGPCPVVAEELRAEKHPEGLEAPSILAASVAFNESEPCNFSPGANNEHAATWALDMLKNNADAGGKLWLHMRLVVPRAYFTLANFIDLDARITESEETANTVAAILRGEKPAGADCTITVAESDRNQCEVTFHVHKATVARTSEQFEKIFRLGVSCEGIRMECGKEGRYSMKDLTAEDMQVVIPLMYGLNVPLPRNYDVVKTIRDCFNKGGYLRDMVAPQWERMIVKEALALDKVDVGSSLQPLLRLIAVSWSGTYDTDWLPMAYRVTIGLLVDMAHLNAGDKYMDYFRNVVVPPFKEQAGFETAVGIFRSILGIHLVLSEVRKRGVNAGRAEDHLAAGDQKKEKKVVDDDKYEEVDGFNPHNMKCKCVIS